MAGRAGDADRLQLNRPSCGHGIQGRKFDDVYLGHEVKGNLTYADKIKNGVSDHR
jgi:hypothetical protein